MEEPFDAAKTNTIKKGGNLLKFVLLYFDCISNIIPDVTKGTLKFGKGFFFPFQRGVSPKYKFLKVG